MSDNSSLVAGESSPAVPQTMIVERAKRASHFELYRAMALAGRPSGLAVTPAELLGDLKSKLDNAAATASKDPFGFGTSWGAGDTPTHGAALAVIASEYDHLTHSRDYDAYSRG